MKKRSTFYFIRRVSIGFFFIAAFNIIHAQDIIIKKDNEEIKAKILEVGTTEIKYKLFDLPDGPTMTILKTDVKTLKLKAQNGKVISMDESKPDPMSISNRVIMDKTSSLKFNFFSPLNRQLAFSYEWMIHPGFNWETGLGIVGPGVSVFDQFLNLHPKGVYLRTGCKFLLGSSSDIEIEGAKYAHPLKGRYFKIEATLYALSTNYNTTISNNYNYRDSVVSIRDHFTGAALQIIYGRQWIFGNSVTVGWYIGCGYAYEAKTSSYSTYDIDDLSRYAFRYGGSTFPVAGTIGFNVGYIFKTPYWLSNLTSPRVSNAPPSRHSLGND